MVAPARLAILARWGLDLRVLVLQARPALRGHRGRLGWVSRDLRVRLAVVGRLAPPVRPDRLVLARPEQPELLATLAQPVHSGLDRPALGALVQLGLLGPLALAGQAQPVLAQRVRPAQPALPVPTARLAELARPDHSEPDLRVPVELDPRAQLAPVRPDRLGRLVCRARLARAQRLRDTPAQRALALPASPARPESPE